MRRHLVPLALLAALVSASVGLAADGAFAETTPVTADAYVNLSDPAATFGSTLFAKATLAPEKRAYLRFATTIPVGYEVDSASLTFTSSRASAFGLEVRDSTSFDEATLSANTAPPLGAVITQTPAFYVDVPVTTLLPVSAVHDGVTAFSLHTLYTSADGSIYTRESGRGGATLTYTVRPIAPTVTITSPPGDSTSTDAAVGFATAGGPATVECSMDSGAWSACTSAATYSGLAVGSHTFAVRATNTTGTQSASTTWSVLAPPPVDRLAPVGPFDVDTARKFVCEGNAAQYDYNGDGQVRIRVTLPRDLSGAPMDGIQLQCTGTITEARVYRAERDGFKVNRDAIGLHVLTGSVTCDPKDGLVHQDGVQALGGNGVTFGTEGVPGAFTVSCETGNNGAIWINAGNQSDPNDSTLWPTAILCIYCDLANRNAALHIGAQSVDSGARNSTLHLGTGDSAPADCRRIDGIRPVDVDNTCEPSPFS